MYTTVTSFQNQVFLLFFYEISFTFIKIYNKPSFTYYQDYSERYVKDVKVFVKKKKKKSDNMAVKDTKIYQKMKNKSWLSIEKIL